MRLLLALLLLLPILAKADALFVTVNQDWACTGTCTFFDDFNYDVTCDVADDAANLAAFQAAGWETGKAENLPSRANAYGYLCTVSSIPGFSGQFPTLSSPRVLLNRSTSADNAGQANYFLQLGDATGPNTLIPADAWIQFWAYNNYFGSELSEWHIGKFLYPCRGQYPCQSGGWLQNLEAVRTNPYCDAPGGTPSTAGPYIENNVFGGVTSGALNCTGGSCNNCLAQDIPETIGNNRWVLVRIHYDTRGAQGIYEAWLRPFNQGWTKVAEYIGGVTAGFDWPIDPAEREGHNVMQMPSIVGGVSDRWTNHWFYMADFTIASSFAGLPTYPDEP